jgi:hypothetical protein
MRQYSKFIGVFALVLLNGCKADLADGNPCHAIVHTLCDLAASCNWPNADHCVDYSATFEASCGASADAARSCASDLEDLGCGTENPASCTAIDPVFFPPTDNSGGSDNGGGSSNFGGGSSSVGGSRSSGGSTGVGGSRTSFGGATSVGAAGAAGESGAPNEVGTPVGTVTTTGVTKTLCGQLYSDTYEDGTAFSMSLTAGQTKFAAPTVPASFNDVTSSIYVAPGCSVTVYTNSQYTGTSTTYTSTAFALPIGVDNQTSSAICSCDQTTTMPGSCAISSGACSTCLETSCITELDNCETVTACGNSLSTYASCQCAGTSTENQCASSFVVSGGATAKTVYDCLASYCAAECLGAI